MWRIVKGHIGVWLPALRSRNYRLYFIGQGISLVGTWMAAVAEQWLVYPTLTDNRSLLGIVSAVNLAPTAALVLLAGVVADRVNRRRVQMLLQFLFALISFTMAFLIFTGLVRVWHVFLAVFLSGVVFAFDLPTRQALMMETVEKKEFASALSLNAGIFNAARALGPAAAGIVIASIGIAPAYVLNGVSFFAVIVSVMLMHRHLGMAQTATDVSVRESFGEGVAYVRGNRSVTLLFLLLTLLTITTWPAVTLMAVFAHDIFHAGAVGFGMLQSAFGAGAMVAAFGFARVIARTRDTNRLLVGAIIAVSVALGVFGISAVFPLALVTQVVLGMAISTIYSFITTRIQSDIPQTLRGRILSFTSFVLISGMPVGALLASLGVVTIGARMTVFAGAVLFGICSSCIMVVLRKQV